MYFIFQETLIRDTEPDHCVLQVNGATLKQVEKIKYLGVALTSDGIKKRQRTGYPNRQG